MGIVRVLVTGGAGYVGSHAAKALALDGHEVITLDNLSTGHAWAVKWGPLVRGDVGDSQLVLQTLDEYQPDAVMHFAGSAFVGESMTDPGRYFANNVAAAFSLLEAVVSDGTRPFVFSSTCAVYGIPARLPINEEEEHTPLSPYGESKLMVERALRWYGEIHGLPWSALRYFNAAGADDDGQLGELHIPEPHLIPRVIATASEEAVSLKIFGTDYPTRDGTAIRDYVHVADLANAHVQALARLEAGMASGGLNLGTGIGFTVLEVIAAIEGVTGRSVPYVDAPRRPGDPAELVADASRAASALGWGPRSSSLVSMVSSAWEWHRTRADVRI